jgi:hypothetical protein
MIDYENVYFKCERVYLLNKQFHFKYCSFSLYSFFHEIHFKKKGEEEGEEEKCI